MVATVPTLCRTDRGAIEDLIGDRDRIAFLQQPFAFDPSLVARQRVSSKPRGLWYGCGLSWLTFAYEDQDPGWLEDYVYRFDLDFDRIFRIRTYADMRAFESAFLVEDEYGDLTPDWARVKKESGASGVEICPYRYEKRLREWTHREDAWYIGWDVASGCLWDERAIRSATLLARLRPRVNYPARSTCRGTTPMRRRFYKP